MPGQTAFGNKYRKTFNLAFYGLVEDENQTFDKYGADIHALVAALRSLGRTSAKPVGDFVAADDEHVYVYDHRLSLMIIAGILVAAKAAEEFIPPEKRREYAEKIEEILKENSYLYS